MMQEERDQENVENMENQQMQMDQNIVAYKKIEELENFGVNRTDITKLKTGGFNTIEALAHSTLKKIQDVKGISEQKAQKLKVSGLINTFVYAMYVCMYVCMYGVCMYGVCK